MASKKIKPKQQNIDEIRKEIICIRANKGRNYLNYYNRYRLANKLRISSNSNQYAIPTVFGGIEYEKWILALSDYFEDKETTLNLLDILVEKNKNNVYEKLLSLNDVLNKLDENEIIFKANQLFSVPYISNIQVINFEMTTSLEIFSVDNSTEV